MLPTIRDVRHRSQCGSGTTYSELAISHCPVRFRSLQAKQRINSANSDDEDARSLKFPTMEEFLSITLPKQVTTNVNPNISHTLRKLNFAQKYILTPHQASSSVTMISQSDIRRNSHQRPEVTVPSEQAMTGTVLSIGLPPTPLSGTSKQVLPPPGLNPSQIWPGPKVKLLVPIL
jgi:hypothetical protein